jgi:hypothetical protein
VLAREAPSARAVVGLHSDAERGGESLDGLDAAHVGARDDAKNPAAGEEIP